LRAKQTAKIVAKATGAKILIDKRFSELNCGIFNWRPVEEYRNFTGHGLERFTKASPGGENLNEVKKRMLEAVLEINSCYQNKNILIVSHGDPLFVLEGALKGLSLRYRLSLIGLIAMTGAWWFYEKLGWSTLHIPGGGDIQLGWLYIPIFFIVMIATYSGGIIDGLDGLAGGTFASMFAAYAVIAFAQHQIDLAAFCITLVGTILAFLWFNIPPARFYMGEAGMMGLTATLTVVAFLTDSVLVLPIIAFPLVLESGSTIIQFFSKKFFKRKVFLATPIHHHFEALGWPHYQITMRFWVIGIVMAIAGVAIRLLG